MITLMMQWHKLVNSTLYICGLRAGVGTISHAGGHPNRARPSIYANKTALRIRIRRKLGPGPSPAAYRSAPGGRANLTPGGRAPRAGWVGWAARGLGWGWWGGLGANRSLLVYFVGLRARTSDSTPTGLPDPPSGVHASAHTTRGSGLRRGVGNAGEICAFF